MPERLQRSREKGWKKPPNSKYVGRPSVWGNDWMAMEFDGKWMVGKYDRQGFLGLPKTLTGSFETAREARIECIRLHRVNLRESLKEKARRELRGLNILCWCAAGEPCHGDTWLEIANS